MPESFCEAVRLETVPVLADALPPPLVKPKRCRLPAQERLNMEAENGMWSECDAPTVYLPTPEQIATECAAIRADWSDEEHYIRATLRPEDVAGSRTFGIKQARPRWRVPVIRMVEGMVTR